MCIRDSPVTDGTGHPAQAVIVPGADVGMFSLCIGRLLIHLSLIHIFILILLEGALMVPRTPDILDLSIQFVGKLCPVSKCILLDNRLIPQIVRKRCV